MMPEITRRTVALLLLGGCTAQQLAPPPPGGWVSLPPDSVAGAGDPTRAAILSTASVFGNPASVAGNPAAAARAVAQYEFLATEIPTGPRWVGFQPTTFVLLGQGRVALRNALGIAQDAPTQPIIETMFAASRALMAGDQAAAERVLTQPFYSPGGAALLAKLSALPMIPQVNQATSMAQADLMRQDRGTYSRPGGGNRS